MILTRCAILKLIEVQPKFLALGDMRAGEKDNFHTLSREKGEWFFYRRMEQIMTESEKIKLQESSMKSELVYQPSIRPNIIKMEIPKSQGEFYNKINSISGCRISPITLQSKGDVYISVEFDESRENDVTDKILDYSNADSPYKKEIIYVGTDDNQVPFLLNLYASMNSLSDLTLIRTRWLFKENEAKTENEGIFQNTGDFILKQFVDDETDQLIWRTGSKEIKGNAKAEFLDEEKNIVEMNVRSRFFSDFHRSIIQEYCGVIFSGYRCDEKGLNNFYIVEKRAQNRFLLGLQKHWSLQARNKHSNHLSEVIDLGLYKNLSDIPL